MRFYFSILLLFALSTSLLTGCGSDSNPPPPLKDGSFSKIESVPTLNVHTLNSADNLLLAGTGEGAYKKLLDQSIEGWRQAGLNIDSANIVDLIMWNDQDLLATINYSNEEKIDDDKADLFKSNNGSNNWQPIEAIYELPNGEKVRSAPDILELSIGEPSKLFGPLSVSEDSGKTWSVIDNENSEDTHGFPDFLTVSEYHSSHIWTGGRMTIFSPYLAKSEDGGETWTLLNDQFYFNSDATVYDVVVHPDDPDRVLAGTGGAVGPANVIRRSNDGGQSWQTVLEGYNIRTLAHSAQDPRVVYASGIDPESRSLFFAASTNFGDDWQVITPQETEFGALFINDIISVIESGTEVLYFGTTKGIYSYRFEE